MFDLTRQEIKNPVGLMLDPNPSDLGPQSWSDGRNIRFKNGRVSKAQGHEVAFPDLPGAREPLFAMPFLSQAVPYWFVAAKDRIYRTEGQLWQEVTRTSNTYSAAENFPWNGGFLSGLAVLNNGYDVPQKIGPYDNNFIDLPNWPATLRTKILRPFKNYLIALNITKDSVQMPTVVKWSSPADPGEVPFTWNEADPTNDAGENPLADTAGAIVDGKKLRDSFIIYKEDSVYSMRYVGGVYVFQFQQLYDDVGMLAPNCAAEFDGKHFVIGQGDVYVHNGVQKKSVIDGVMKNYLFNAIKAGGTSAVFVVPDYSNSEMWVCFQSTSGALEGGYADQAAIWNWQENTWTLRDLPQVRNGTMGVVDPQEPDHWDLDPAQWDVDATVWGSSTYNPAKMKVVLVSATNKKIYVIGESSLFAGVPFKSTIERTNLYDGNDQSVKHVTTVTPHITGTGVCNVFVGANMIMDSPTEWYGPYPYNIGKDFKINCRVSGRSVGFRFEFDSVGSWEFNGYTVETTKPIGKR